MAFKVDDKEYSDQAPLGIKADSIQLGATAPGSTLGLATTSGLSSPSGHPNHRGNGWTR